MTAPLPLRDGVAPSYVWLGPGQWDNILSFLVQRFPAISTEQWRSRLARREVVSADGVALHAESVYQSGVRIFYYRELEYETPIPFEAEVLFQDDHLVVVDKPHFLPMTPAGRFLQETLLVRLKKKLGIEDLSPIHRLDRETAGVVMFSSRVESRGAYQSLFQKRAVEKVYEALAAPLTGREFPFVYRSRMEEGTPFFRMQEVAGEPNSETLIDVIEHRAGATLYRLHPRTGRKHQLRVHLAALGIPIFNDPFYPVALPDKGDDMSQPLQLLARSIGFVDPITGQTRQFESRRRL